LSFRPVTPKNKFNSSLPKTNDDLYVVCNGLKLYKFRVLSCNLDIELGGRYANILIQLQRQKIEPRFAHALDQPQKIDDPRLMNKNIVNKHITDYKGKRYKAEHGSPQIQ
jgi:hypothetical protein